jgi:protein-L-isoaspartate(D-aspartate) O-methyltransferase
MIDFEAQRLAMIESQLRPNEVRELRLLDAVRAVPRERFVPPKLRALAYMDGPIEVSPSIDGAPARYLLAPMVLARLIQLASVEPEDSVLDIGCATGYSTAILARLGRKVVGLEPEPELAGAARDALQQLGVQNAEIVEAPLAEGQAAFGPYDVILMNGAVPRIPESLSAQLKEGGRIAAILSPSANGSQGKAHLLVKVHGRASGLPHFDAGATPLPGFAPVGIFAF